MNCIQRHVVARRIFLALGFILVTHAGFPEPLKLYVSPQGRDAWSGERATREADGSDGPLATIQGARDALRRIKAVGPLTEGAIVEIAGGSYHVTEPILFTEKDSGSTDAPIVYRAAEGQSPVVHGGRAIENWKREGDLWVADLPLVRDGGWSFNALWVNGERRMPARTPNATHPFGDDPTEADFFYAAGQISEPDPGGGEAKKSATKFRYRPGDLENWDALEDAVVVVFHSWATSLLRVKNLDEGNHVVEFTGPARWHFGRWKSDQRYYVEHFFEALDAPGEWYLQRETGKLFYRPMAGEEIETSRFVAPVARQLLLLRRTQESGPLVRHLEFHGLTFAYSDYPIAPEGHSDSQAAFAVDAAIETSGTTQCLFERCTIAHVGGHGIWFRAGSQANTVRECEIHDLGAGGVRIGEGRSPAPESDHAIERMTIENNFIHDGGKVFRSAVGVWIGRSSNNLVAHNEISHFRYTGVSVGWLWGYAESTAHHNRIEYNHIHDIGLGQLNDMGGIYTLGVSPGTVLRGNVIHDVVSHPRLYGGWGLYTDEGSSEIVLEDNLVYRTTTGGFHQHYGRDNIVRNNIFAFSQGPQIIRTRDEEHNSFTFERNIVYFDNGQLLGSRWGNGNWTMNRNCYWDTSGGTFDFSGRSFEQWRAEGHDADSIIADPLFVNPDEGDFRLKPNSPALSSGFRPFDFSKAGLYGRKEWVERPAKAHP